TRICTAAATSSSTSRWRKVATTSSSTTSSIPCASSCASGSSRCCRPSRTRTTPCGSTATSMKRSVPATSRARAPPCARTWTAPAHGYSGSSRAVPGPRRTRGAMADTFRVGVTRDFLKADGTLGFGDIGLGLLEEAAGVGWEFLGEEARELSAEQVAGYDALLVLGPRVTAATLAGAERLAVVARFGVGYDSVDVGACTAQGVLLTITPDGVRRPVAAAVLTLLLALTHGLLEEDGGRGGGGWGEKLEYGGGGVSGRTLGIIGLGNIGREIVRLATPFDLRVLACD